MDDNMKELVAWMEDSGVSEEQIRATVQAYEKYNNEQKAAMPSPVPTQTGVAGYPVRVIRVDRDVRIQVLPSGWIITNLVGVSNTVDVFTDMPKMLKHLERILARG